MYGDDGAEEINPISYIHNLSLQKNDNYFNNNL